MPRCHNNGPRSLSMSVINGFWSVDHTESRLACKAAVRHVTFVNRFFHLRNYLLVLEINYFVTITMPLGSAIVFVYDTKPFFPNLGKVICHAQMMDIIAQQIYKSTTFVLPSYYKTYNPTPTIYITIDHSNHWICPSSFPPTSYIMHGPNKFGRWFLIDFYFLFFFLEDLCMWSNGPDNLELHASLAMTIANGCLAYVRLLSSCLRYSA
jgi:hypothetical protein